MSAPSQFRPGMSPLVIPAIVIYSLLSGAAYLVSRIRGEWHLYHLEEHSNGWWLVLGPTAGVATGLCVVVLSRIASSHFRWAQDLLHEFQILLGRLTPLEVIVLAATSAIGEELFFRGALQPWIGLWPQAIVFALLHVGPGLRFLPWTVSAFFMGLVFGGLFQWSGNLGAPIAAHFTINALNLHFISNSVHRSSR